MLALTALVLLALPFAQPSRAQDDVTPLMSNLVQGDEEAGGQSNYYSFVAGPGDFTVTGSGATNSESSTLNVVVRDSEDIELCNMVVPASAGARPVTCKPIHLKRQMPLTMQVLFGERVGVHIRYQIRLSGAVGMQGAAQPPQMPKVATAPDFEREIAVSPPPSVPVTTRAATTVAVMPPPAAKELSIAPTDAADIINTPVTDKWALIVGVSQFQKPELNLKYPAKDATDLYDYLTKEANFAPDHVRLLLNEKATKQNVIRELGDNFLPRLARPDDLVVIFISSHGSPSQADLEGLNYLVLYNTDPKSLYSTGLSLDELSSAIKHRIKAKRVVLIVDACHSAAMDIASKGITRQGNVDSKALLAGTGQLVICSSSPSEVSWESERYKNGVFTRQLIEALRVNSGKVPLKQAFEKLKKSVVEEVLYDRKELQTPVFSSKWSGDELILSTPPTSPRNVPEDIDH
jgi:hypothetical protein